MIRLRQQVAGEGLVRAMAAMSLTARSGLQGSLSGRISIQLIGCIHPELGNATGCFQTLHASMRCTQAFTEPAAVAQGLKAPKGCMKPSQVESLQAEVACLREELEVTHGHYQKLLEQSNGPGPILMPPRRR